jgi:hypothetical protein
MISLLFLFLSKKFELSYQVGGYMKFKNIRLIIDNEYFFIKLHINVFQIYIIWLKFRIYFQGINLAYLIKNKDTSSLKSNMSKHEFIDAYGNPL